MQAAFPGGNDGAGRELIEYVRVVAVMLLVTGLAAYLPARRAVRIEPTRHCAPSERVSPPRRALVRLELY